MIIRSDKFMDFWCWLLAKLSGDYKRYRGVALGLIAIIRTDAPDSTVVHEKVHIRQFIETLGLFGLLYVGELVFRKLRFGLTWYQAYLDISFEREARAGSKYPDYLKKRKFWAWVGYFRQK